MPTLLLKSFKKEEIEHAICSKLICIKRLLKYWAYTIILAYMIILISKTGNPARLFHSAVHVYSRQQSRFLCDITQFLNPCIHRQTTLDKERCTSLNYIQINANYILHTLPPKCLSLTPIYFHKLPWFTEILWWSGNRGLFDVRRNFC